MSDWKHERNDVLIDENGRWWHVFHRYECRDTGDRMYHLWDATHTGDDIVNAEYLEDSRSEFTAAGWRTDTKPAHENGYRVNGVLTEPTGRERWLGNAVVFDHDCPNCGESTKDDADVIVNLVKRQRQDIWIDCRACGVRSAIDPDA